MAKIQLEAVLKLVEAQVNPQVFRKISQAVAGMPASLGETNKQLKGAAANTAKLNKRLQTTKTQLSANERAARLFLQRMAQFAILLPTFATLNRAIQGSIKFLFEFDSALRDIIRIDISGLKDRMEEVGDAALQTAVDFGVTAIEVLNVTRIFKQAGFTIEESQAKAQAAILATQISTLSSAQAVEVFIAAAKQFGDEGENAIDVLDRLARVEDLAAVNASDVADAFRTGGNALAEFTGSMDDAIGLIAALREQSRKSGREIGTFFKTIQTRVFAVGEARSAVEALGIQIENLDGSLRPTLDVFNDLKKSFDGLTQAQRTNAAKGIAGIRQFESLLAVLNSLERANELSTASSKAAGTAEEKRLITDAKLERQLGRLIAQGQALAEALGDAGLEDSLAGVLKIANGILKVFTSLADVVGGIGGSLTPLLALGGVTLGRSIFGFNKPGGDAGPKAGDKDFIGPLRKESIALTQTFKQNTAQMKTSFAGIFSSSKALAGALIPASIATQRMGQVTKFNVEGIKQSTVALKAHVNSLRAAAGAASDKAFNKLQNSGGALLLTLAGTALPAGFTKLAKGLRTFDNALTDTTADFLDVSKNGIGLAAQFAILGKKASVAAGLFGILQTSIVTILNAVEKEGDARDQLREGIAKQGREIGVRAKLSSKTSVGDAFGARIFDAITRGLRDREGGLETVAAQNQIFAEIGKQAGVAGSEIGTILLQKATAEITKADLTTQGFGDIKSTNDIADLVAELKSGEAGILTTIKAQQAELRARAELNSTLREAENLIGRVEAGTITGGKAFSALKVILDETNRAANAATGAIDIVRISFKEFEDVQKLRAYGDSIRTLGLELELARLGPEALADSVVRLQQEFLLVERESSNTLGRLTENMNFLFQSLGEFTVGLNPAGVSVHDFFKTIKDGVTSIDPEKVKKFEDLIFNPDPENFSKLTKAQKKGAKEILDILKAQISEETKIQDKSNQLQSEVGKRRKALLDEEAKAAQNAFAATQKFNAELAKFGQAVTTDILSAFQNIDLSDIDKVLEGDSELDAAIQELIKNAFGTPVQQAQSELGAVASKTRAELNILARELGLVEEQLADEANAAQMAALTGKKRAIELGIETTKQKSAIEITDAKIKVLEEERQAAEKAIEAEEERAKLLDKLADASRAFAQELKGVERSFKEFTNERIADLLSDESDARSDLKDAQQGVLDSTVELADAYENLIKAQLNFNGVLAEAKLKSSLLARDIAMLTGEVFTFDQGLASLGNAFRDVLSESNITLAKRIDLERQLAEETLSFLTQARDEIVQAGIGIFGQTGGENQALGQGIAGLQFVADQLGGSFESFLQLTQGELSSVTENLLSLPAEFRQQILDALAFLPSTTNIGGFNPEQLRQAIGQVGAGVSAEDGLPSIEDLNAQQVEQLTKLQELAIQDAQLQFSQVIAAQDQLVAAEEAAEAAKLLEERATEELVNVRNAVLEEKVILELANQQRIELTNAIIAADDKNTLIQLERESQLFAEQNAAFSEIGDNIVRGIGALIAGRLATIDAAKALAAGPKFAGHLPNFAGGNLTPGEAAALLRAGAREKRAMPGGAGLAVANTSEAIIPMRAGGFIPNFQQGSSEISAGISAIKSINETVVAAIARSVTAALTDLQTGGGNTEELLTEVITQLNSLNNTSEDISTTNATVASNTQAADAGGAGAAAATTQRVEITLQTNQNNRVTVTGLENLRTELEAAVARTTQEQVGAQVSEMFDQLEDALTSLRERGFITSFGQSR